METITANAYKPGTSGQMISNTNACSGTLLLTLMIPQMYGQHLSHIASTSRCAIDYAPSYSRTPSSLVQNWTSLKYKRLPEIQVQEQRAQKCANYMDVDFHVLLHQRTQRKQGLLSVAQQDLILIVQRGLILIVQQGLLLTARPGLLLQAHLLHTMAIWLETSEEWTVHRNV